MYFLLEILIQWLIIPIYLKAGLSYLISVCVNVIGGNNGVISDCLLFTNTLY